jgi:hypothetical protein
MTQRDESERPRPVAQDVRVARLLAFLATAAGREETGRRLLADAAEWQREDEGR